MLLQRSYREVPFIALLLALGLFLIVICFHLKPSMPDDAFIYLRFVRNLAANGEWAFNDGSPISATTSPLYTLALLGLYWGGLSNEYSLLISFGVGLWLAMVAIYLGTTQSYGRPLAITAALVLVLWPGLLRSIGMESSLFIAAITWCALAYQRDKYRSAGLLAGLVALARPEGIAFLALLLLAERMASKSLKRSFWVVCMASLVVIPWLIYSQWQFGSIVPYTAKMKAVQAVIGWQGNWLFSWIQQLPFPWITLPLAGVGLALAWRSYRQNQPFSLLVIGFGLVQVAGYHLLKAPVDYFWYYVPGNLSVGLAAISGALLISNLAWRKIAGHKYQQIPASSAFTSPNYFVGNPAGILTALLLTVLLAYIPRAWTDFGKPYRMSTDYVDVARWLSQHGDADSVVACDEIGYIGYYSGLPIRDMLGLIDESALAPLKRRQWDWWFTQEPRPQFIVVHAERAWPGEPTLTQASNLKNWVWPARSYNEFTELYTKVYSTRGLKLYELKTSANTRANATAFY